MRADHKRKTKLSAGAGGSSQRLCWFSPWSGWSALRASCADQMQPDAVVRLPLGLLRRQELCPQADLDTLRGPRRGSYLCERTGESERLPVDERAASLQQACAPRTSPVRSAPCRAASEAERRLRAKKSAVLAAPPLSSAKHTHADALSRTRCMLQAKDSPLFASSRSAATSY